MYKMSGYVPGHVLRMMYYSLFYPHLIYGLSVWGGCGATNVDKINRIQIRALSLIEERYCSSIPLPLQKVYLLNLLCKFQTIIHHGSSQYFISKINSLIPDHNHHTRFSQFNNFKILFCVKTVSQRQLLYNAVKRLNDMPSALKEPVSLPTYKRKMKSYLVEM